MKRRKLELYWFPAEYRYQKEIKKKNRKRTNIHILFVRFWWHRTFVCNTLFLITNCVWSKLAKSIVRAHTNKQKCKQSDYVVTEIKEEKKREENKNRNMTWTIQTNIAHCKQQPLPERKKNTECVVQEPTQVWQRQSIKKVVVIIVNN